MSSGKNITVGVVGAAGYTAGELIRILMHHPNVVIKFLHSQSQQGVQVSRVHKDLLGELDQVFTTDLDNVDVLFLCRGHGASRAFLAESKIPTSTKIIDLSQDFRIMVDGNDFVYGLPEAYCKKIKSASKVANPGCFATCIQLALLPLAASNLLVNPVHINAITGSTGAGQSLSDTSHFSWRNNNVSIYKPFQHQHLSEIMQTLNHLQIDRLSEINFLPMRGNFTRGIFASAYMDSHLSEVEANEIFRDYYAASPFVKMTKENPDLKQVVGTNKAIIQVQKIEGKLLVLSMIDNLIKGASGQAVQNMNLMFGFEETEGLKLKSIGF
ncbi:MAG: N-acetyl-gamma-glutamyl-phosphate reductase [Cyclobacteriaceae bacterium]